MTTSYYLDDPSADRTDAATVYMLDHGFIRARFILGNTGSIYDAGQFVKESTSDYNVGDYRIMATDYVTAVAIANELSYNDITPRRG